MKEKRYRTPKDKNKVKNYKCFIYLTENEFNKVKEFCQNNNISISALFRKSIQNVINI